MHLKIIGFTVFLFLVIIVGGLTWFTMLQSPTTNVGPNNNSTGNAEPTFEATVQSLYDDPNSNFNSGYQASLRGDNEEAVAFYKAALSEETDPVRAAHTKYRLARVTEKIDPVEAIRIFKEIADEPTYPDNQKKYAIMWIPVILMKVPEVFDQALAEALKGEPYSTFAGETLNKTARNFYEYSLTFGSTGLAEFAIAEFLAKDIRDGVITEEAELGKTKNRIASLMGQGRAYLEDARTDPRNSALIPLIYRAQARTNAILAGQGEQVSIDMFDQLFLEAINQGLASKLDGAVRWDYFRYSYEVFGAESFEKTQSQLDFLLSNLNTYPSIKDYLATERGDILGTKQQIVKYANANPTLKNKLIELGWTTADF